MRTTTKHLLLVNPWIYDFTAYDLWSKPLGLLYIASFLQKQGFEISLIDCLDNRAIRSKKYGQGKLPRSVVEKPEILKHIPRQFARYGISEEAFRFKIKNSTPPDAILVTSMMTYWYPGPVHAVRLLRDIFPGVPIILGGVYASLMPEHASEYVQPDHIIQGPGEYAVLKLLSELLSLTYGENGLSGSLDDYPYPAFHLLGHLRYLVLLTSRGCPYNCPCLLNNASLRKS
jgi:hypothetical protein